MEFSCCRNLKKIPFSPALVPFTFTQEDLSGILADLSGVSVEVEATCAEGEFRENLLFTHRGLSGPAMLQISSYWKKGMQITIDLLPTMNALEWLGNQQQQRPKAELKTVLTELFPKRLAQRLCEYLLPNRTMAQYTAKELEQITGQLHAWTLLPAGTEGMRTAEVALGGVDTQELSSKTCESRNRGPRAWQA